MSWRALILSLALAAPLRAATEVHLALIRFRPDKKSELLAATKLKAGNSEAIVAELGKRGAAALLFESAETFAEEKPKTIEKSETAAVVMPGESAEFPRVTKVAVKFELLCAPRGEASAISWNGTVRWSPELVDRVGKLGALPALKTNAHLIRAFAPAGQTAGFEYPVLKETGFQSSKLLKPGEVAITSTVAESGGQAAEALLLAIWAARK